MKITFRLIGLLFASGIVMFISGCNKSDQREVTEGLKGHYVNQSFLSHIRDTIAGGRPAYCYELHFISNDSVRVFYGFEEETFAYQKVEDEYFHKYVIKKAMQGRDLAFETTPHKNLVLKDSSWTKTGKNSDFTKSYTSDPKKWTFPAELNKATVAGTYGLFEKDLPIMKQVVFSADGKVKGLGDFTSYEVCFSGDCVEEVLPLSNNITLTDSKGNATVYAVQFGNHKRLKLLHIEKPRADIKGERKITNLAFDLRPI